MIKTGLTGTLVMGICCFTPLLVVVLGGLGLSAWLGWLDYVLLPALGVSMAVLAFGLYQRQKRGGHC